MKTIEFKPEVPTTSLWLREELIDDAYDALSVLRNCNQADEASFDYLNALHRFRRCAEALGSLEAPEVRVLPIMPKFLRINDKALGLLICFGAATVSAMCIFMVWVRFFSRQ